MPISIHHLRAGNASRWAVRRDGEWAVLDGTLAELLALPLDQARAVVEAAVREAGGDMPGEDRFHPLTGRRCGRPG